MSKNPYEAPLRYSSQRSVEMFKLFGEAFGDPKRVVRVAAAQSASPWTGKTELDWQNAFKSADAVAIAPYFGNRLGDPKSMPETAKLSVEQVLEECRKDVAANAKVIREYAELARKRNLRLLAYEGGQHLAGYGGAENNEALTKLFLAANRHPGIEAVYAQDLKQWFDLGGGHVRRVLVGRALLEVGELGVARTLGPAGGRCPQNASRADGPTVSVAYRLAPEMVEAVFAGSGCPPNRLFRAR